jgi:hypothetical protein
MPSWTGKTCLICERAEDLAVAIALYQAGTTTGLNGIVACFDGPFTASPPRYDGTCSLIRLAVQPQFRSRSCYSGSVSLVPPNTRNHK